MADAGGPVGVNALRHARGDHLGGDFVSHAQAVDDHRPLRINGANRAAARAITRA